MKKIKIKTFFSIIISKIILYLSKRIFGGGSNFPGRIALKLDNDILREVSKGYKVILITGTNGKTTTSSMVYNILKENGSNVITNNTGANMLTGVISCFLDNFSFKKNSTEKYAVIECDEANVRLVNSSITPEVISITNLFRDQLDRFGEVYTTLKKILMGLEYTTETTLVLNGDESLLGDLNLPNPIIYYGFKDSIDKNTEVDINADAKFCKKCKSAYSYHHISYNHLGDYYCRNCGYKRPELNYYVNKIVHISALSSLVDINGTVYSINLPGIYNIYNGLCAYSIGKTLGITDKTIKSSLSKQSSTFGRQETITIEDKKVTIILVKNPAGFNQSIETVALDKDNISLCFLLNDNYADGKDVSWIFDVNFEKLKNLSIDSLFFSGIRLYDMATRLKIVGLDTEKFIPCEDYNSLLEGITASKSKQIYVLATYTAMLSFRKHINSKGYIKNIW